MVPEAELRETEAGLVPASVGWFVLNARDARWFDKPEQGHSVPLTGYDEYEAETFFPMLGMAIRVVRPRRADRDVPLGDRAGGLPRPLGRGAADRRGQERPLRKWDFVHCPPRTRHAFVGAGDEPLVLLCASSRQFQKDGPWGYYLADETAARHNASSPEDTQDNEVADAVFPPGRETRYPDGLLPD